MSMTRSFEIICIIWIFSEQYLTLYDKHRHHLYDRTLEVAHTIARQTIYLSFGNSISPSWWSDAWLNEAITTFLQYYLLDKVVLYIRAISQNHAVKRKKNERERERKRNCCSYCEKF